MYDDDEHEAFTWPETPEQHEARMQFSRDYAHFMFGNRLVSRL